MSTLHAVSPRDPSLKLSALPAGRQAGHLPDALSCPECKKRLLHHTHTHTRASLSSCIAEVRLEDLLSCSVQTRLHQHSMAQLCTAGGIPLNFAMGQIVCEPPPLLRRPGREAPLLRKARSLAPFSGLSLFWTMQWTVVIHP